MSNYISLVYKLQQRFGCPNHHQVYWLAQPDARVRSSGESVAALADDLLLLARRVHPNLDHKSAMRLALQQFYKSIEPELTWRCTEIDWRSHDDALK